MTQCHGVIDADTRSCVHSLFHIEPLCVLGSKLSTELKEMSKMTDRLGGAPRLKEKNTYTQNVEERGI